ncbi:hypothetical protein [Nonomuraea cavernae]|uniref:Uncharacterized protein n=1 Tax=Nonomuraea cavernae TaxID=2045107 RepID=A0A917Z2B1_9ACTN|nr:hypothetical protein [Nonomuraea cavernae]MCA2187617.1 hypothetical protein [Nonomuraea cavernae]GGO71019.1 hypothetical protein GCM10012289_35810 [Nonomuraea cavernae]
MRTPAIVSDAVAWAAPHWTRGQAGRETPPDLFRVLYYGWLVALTLKLLGSAWDVSWHFKWLRDDLAPPHLLNSAGTVLVLALTIVHGYTGYGVDKAALRLIQWGTGVFLVAVPLDLINHRVNGLDITSWSPSHIMLYAGTFLMIAGVIRGWFMGAPAGRERTVVLGAFFAFFLENVHFPEQHQEYGILSIGAWDNGATYAEPILLRFAADQMGRPIDRVMMTGFALPVPDALYPVYAVVAGLAVLVVARMMIGRFGAATLVAAGYVAFRTLIWPLLTFTGFPPSAVPFFLVIGGLCVDLAFAVRMPVVRAVLGSAMVTAAVYAALAAQSTLMGQVYGTLTGQSGLLGAPPLVMSSAVWAGAGLLAVWLVCEWLARRQPIEARVIATATP